MSLAVDTETTGLDLHHGAEPFLVTFCNDLWENTWFEWDVNPLTRAVLPDPDDVEEIVRMIEEADELILQNAKFDVTALYTVLPWDFKWPWEKTRDTLFAGHLLQSNHQHSLEAMSIEYLGIDPSPYESRMKKLVVKCRNFCKRKASPLKHWRIADYGLPEMPSAKKGNNKEEAKVWKYDLWLPRAILKATAEDTELRLAVEAYFSDDELEALETITADYANTDSLTTVAIWKKQKKLIEERGLGKIFANRMKIAPIIERMQSNGVTANGDRLEELQLQYLAETKQYGSVCTGIASTYGHELTLPKSGNNNSLTSFCFDADKLALPVIAKSAKTGVPSLNQKVVEAYQLILPARSKQLVFINNLAAKRKRDTSLIYMEGYKRFWTALAEAGFFRLFPFVNPTGTDTLRMSSSNPNEQNISKKGMFDGDYRTLRYLFGPRPGREWWSLDAKNIELRIPAYESKEDELIRLFERPDDPPYYGSTHLLNFHTVYPDMWELELEKLKKELGSWDDALLKVGPACKKRYANTWYQYCKNGGFAVQYGAIEREGGTADQAFHREGCHALLKARFDNLEGLNQSWIQFANEKGYVETMPDKFVDPDNGYPLLCTRSNWGDILPTVPLNYHVQGTAMWWMCQAMIRCQAQLDEWTEEEGYDGFITMQVHDELVFDLPAGSGDEPWRTNYDKIDRLAALMAKGGEGIGVPTPVGIEYHTTVWSEGKTLR